MPSASAPRDRRAARARQSTSTREALRRHGPTRRQLSRHERELRQQRRLLWLGGGLVAIVALVLGLGYLRENYLRASETVAVVFGERLTAQDLLNQAKPQLNQIDRRAALYRANNMSQQAAQLDFQRLQLPEQVLNLMVEQRVVRREATSRGVEVTPAEIDERLRQLAAQADSANLPQPTPTASPAALAGASPTSTAAGTPTRMPSATPVPTLTGDRYGPALQDYLNNSGYTEAQLRQSVEADLYEQKLRDALGQPVPAGQEQVQARHLVFKTQDEANAALQSLQAGVSFDDLAGQQPDSGAASKGGVDLGWLPKMGRDPMFDEALFALEPGQTSPVVQTLNGFEILQTVAQDPARTVEPDLLDELRKRQYGDWLAGAEGSPEIDRQLTPEKRDWILAHAVSKKG